MSARFTPLWALLAAALFAFILLVERHWEEPARGPRFLLSGMDLPSIHALEVRWPGSTPLRVEKDKDQWWLVQPVRDSADSARIRALFQALTTEPVQTVLTTGELLQRPTVLEDFGLAEPRATLWLYAPDRRVQIQFGKPTAPGDQVFVQVVGQGELWVVSSEVLSHLPRQADDWRNREWIRLANRHFDRLVISNQWGQFALEHAAGSPEWRLVEPLRARADPEKVQAAWDALAQLQVTRFVGDEPGVDLEMFGLQPPVLSVTLLDGTNQVERFDFGHSPTNDPAVVFARQRGRSVVVTVPAGPLAAWKVAYSEYRDRRLLRWNGPVTAVELLGPDSFAVHRLPSGWRLLPLDLPADETLVDNLLRLLQQLEVVEFVKDVVIEPDLARYGLAPPAWQIVLRKAPESSGRSHSLLGELHFGLSQEGKTFVRRPDESAVYAVRTEDLGGLPPAAHELRDRRIWRLEESQIERVIVRQGPRHRELVRLGDYSWTLAPGSQGIINSLAVGEAVHALCDLVAVAWLGVGETKLGELGFGQNDWSVTLRRRDGEEFTVTFAGVTPDPLLRAMVRLEGKPWVFLCPPAAGELASAHLRLPQEAAP
ncbi:MAG: DUF4340 domain-containing protein [Limisphaera sp.]